MCIAFMVLLLCCLFLTKLPPITFIHGLWTVVGRFSGGPRRALLFRMEFPLHQGLERSPALTQVLFSWWWICMPLFRHRFRHHGYNNPRSTFRQDHLCVPAPSTHISHNQVTIAGSLYMSCVRSLPEDQEDILPIVLCEVNNT